MTARDEVLFRGRGWTITPMNIGQVFVTFLVTAVLSALLAGLVAPPGARGVIVLEMPVMIAAIIAVTLFFSAWIWLKVQITITVRRSEIEVNGSRMEWKNVSVVIHHRMKGLPWLGPYNPVHKVEVESTDGRRLVFRLKESDFQRFLRAIEEALGKGEAEKKVRESERQHSERGGEDEATGKDRPDEAGRIGPRVELRARELPGCCRDGLRARRGEGLIPRLFLRCRGCGGP